MYISSSDYPSEKEQRLAKEWIEGRKREFRRKRNVSYALSFLFFAILFGLVAIKLPIMGFCSLMISLILLMRGMDAQGTLNVIGLESTKTLYPRMWIFDRNPPASSSTVPKISS
jgi:hypothetical protein